MNNSESKYFSNEPPQLFTYTIGGVKIEMPVKPYPSQVSMMDKVIRGCQKQQNCLLESPTGSGKTLALLCSALSWQKSEKERLNKIFQEEEEEFIKNNKSAEVKPAQTNVSLSKKKEWSSRPVSEDDSEEEMSVFKQPGKRRKINKIRATDVMSVDVNETSYNDSIISNDSSVNNSLITDDEDENFESQINNKNPKIQKKPKLVVPVIYFCTRTHKQIEQVIKELRRTSFNDVVKSCVLASREHTCIQDSDIHFPQISYKSKTELCRGLMDPRARLRNTLKYRRQFDKCNYYDNGGIKISTYGQLSQYGVSSVWDIEDIIQLGRKKKTCPYFGSRLLFKTADIVFCPYNYIIDPVIRGTMKMKLQGHVIIVDEAHNIEDTCREAASLQLEQSNLISAKNDLENLSNGGNNSTMYAALAKYLANLSKWIDQKANSIKTYDDYNRGVISWSGTYTIASFDENDIGLNEFVKFKKNCEIIMADLDDEAEIDENAIADQNDGNKLDPTDTDGKEIEQNESDEEKTDDNEKKSKNKYSTEDELITNATKTMLTAICTVFGLFFDDVYKNDYHVSLEKVMQVKKFEDRERATTDLNGWINCAEPKDSHTVWNNTVSFLCLNPSAVFQELKATARSIILTSGTLSPMQSFQSELGTSFPITLEANHVIKQNQCWVTSVSYGPTQIDLNSQYQNTNTYGYQDEMGRVLKDICENVPYGVLCFVPSYLLMEKLYNRWQVTGLLRELNRIKVVLCEPRKGNELEKLMGTYYKAIKKASNRGKNTSQLSGALFLAVYRGKISEGLDFSDNNARAVVAIGIPFPNFKDATVTHKKDYNDKHHKNRGLLPGWEWYQIQAYRALNQALGRCIRHRNDWGAILLIDSRYGQSKNIAGLSKWIRGKVEHNSNWSTIITKLNDFIELRQQEDANHIV